MHTPMSWYVTIIASHKLQSRIKYEIVNYLNVQLKKKKKTVNIGYRGDLNLNLYANDKSLQNEKRFSAKSG